MGKVLHASASGYFPFCITDGEPPLTSDFYLELTLEQIMAIFWRVKTWEGKTSGSYIYTPYPGAPEDELVTFSPNSFETMSTNYYVENEENLVCGITNPPNAPNAPNLERDIVVVFSRTDGSDPGPYPTKLSWGLNFQPLYRNNSLYYLESQINAVGIAGNVVVNYNNYKVGTYKIAFLEYNITGNIYQFYESTGGSVSLEIRAKEYWSYGGTYNTETGKPL
jgi:hypothetical protein